MCTFLVMMVPESADLAHTLSVASGLGFAPREIGAEPRLPRVWQRAVLLDPDGGPTWFV